MQTINDRKENFRGEVRGSPEEMVMDLRSEGWERWPGKGQEEQVGKSVPDRTAAPRMAYVAGDQRRGHMCSRYRWMKWSWKGGRGSGYGDKTWLSCFPPSRLIFLPGLPACGLTLLKSLFSNAARMILRENTNLIMSLLYSKHFSGSSPSTSWRLNSLSRKPTMWLREELAPPPALGGLPTHLRRRDGFRMGKSSGGECWRSLLAFRETAIESHALSDQTRRRKCRETF